jgi:5-methylcytosine-specific restriction endonuclease McrA
MRRAHHQAHREHDRAYKFSHREQANARARQRYRDPSRRPLTPEQRAAHREHDRRWLAVNAEKKRQQVKRWAKEHKEQSAAVAKRWSDANPEKKRQYSRRARQTASGKARSKIHCRMRYARRRGASVERVDPSVVFERDGGVCGICRAAVDINETWHIDHVIPLSKGGAHSYSNVQLAHARCNCSKGAKVA